MNPPPGRGRARLALFLAIAIALGLLLARRIEHPAPPRAPEAAAPVATTAPPPAEVSARTPVAAGARDLALDERHGGHALRRHVGRSDAELAERLRRERGIAAASTFVDRATAERAVGQVLATQRDAIERWSRRGARRPNLVLFGCDPSERPVGRSLARGEARAREVACARVVLRADGDDFYVLTAYPAVASARERP